MNLFFSSLTTNVRQMIQAAPDDFLRSQKKSCFGGLRRIVWKCDRKTQPGSGQVLSLSTIFYYPTDHLTWLGFDQDVTNLLFSKVKVGVVRQRENYGSLT